MIKKRIIRIILSLVSIVLCISIFSVICNHPAPDAENTIDSFYREEENSLDIVFLGSSASMFDIFPNILWKESNITSYNFSIVGSNAITYKSMLKEIESTQSDSIVFVDIDGFLVDDDEQQRTEPIEWWIDYMPNNRNKFDTINELCKDNKIERYFPFAKYHKYMTSLGIFSSAINIEKKKINNTVDPMKGTTINTRETKSVKFYDSEFEPQKLSPVSESILYDFLDYCKESNLDNIVFAFYPKSYFDEESRNRNIINFSRAETIFKIVGDYGYSYYNYNDLDNPAQLNGYEDFSDSLHLSTKGAIKFSKYFSGYLSETYSFNPKSENITNSWNSLTEQADEIIKKSLS